MSRFAGKGEGVPGEGDLRTAGAVDDLDDIEADGDAGMAQEAQPGLRAADEGLFLGGIDGIGGTPGTARGACLDLDEDEGLLLAADEVDLAAIWRTKVAVEDFEAAAPEMPGGKPLANAPEPQVLGLRRRGRGAAGRPGEKFCDESGKVHGL